MKWSGWIGLAAGVLLIGAAKVGPPPVVLELGPVVPTPAATPKPAQKKRLITTLTVQNSPDGETVVSFEATDFADEGKGKTRVLGAKTYSFSEEKPELNDARGKIMAQLRQVERELLRYAERAGPPKERAPLMAPQPGSAPIR
jgi:hypothetical protein